MAGRPSSLLASTPQVHSGTPESSHRADRIERRGWLGIGAVMAVVAATWIPLLTAPFGDDHLGRIIGRYALHLRNLHEQGLLGSHFSADWAPYSSTPYAHHPPLPNLLTALCGLLPGAGEYGIRLPLYLLALLIIPAAAALLRGFAIGWRATLLAVGLLVATPFYWVYGPLMFDLAPILALSAAVVRLRQRPDPPRWLVGTACGAALLATLASWPGIAFATGLGLWLLAGRRLDRVTLLVCGSVLLGVLLSLTFIIGVSGLTNLGNQAEFRTSGGRHTTRQFLHRQWQHTTSLLPIWYLILLPVGVVTGLLDRRTRWYLMMATAFTAGWIIVLNNGAYLHSYWSYPTLIVGLISIGVLLDRLAHLARSTARTESTMTLASLAASVALTVHLGVLVYGPTERRFVAEPTRAGRLVATHHPPAAQQYAWVAGDGLAAPRWLAYYWKRSVKRLDSDALATASARPEDLVLVDLRRRPDWLPGSVGSQAIAREGPYALFRVADLRSAVRR